MVVGAFAGLSFTQVATWFVNARKRVWKPLIHQDANHDELTGAAALRDTPLCLTGNTGPEAPDIDFESDATASSECSGRGTISQHEADESESEAHDVNQDTGDVDMHDADDLAESVPPPPAGVSTHRPTSPEHPFSSSQHRPTSPERPFSSPVTSPYRLMIPPFNQRDNMYAVAHPLHLQQEIPLAETYDQYQGLALFPTAFPTTSPCISPDRACAAYYYPQPNQIPLYTASTQCLRAPTPAVRHQEHQEAFRALLCSEKAAQP